MEKSASEEIARAEEAGTLASIGATPVITRKAVADNMRQVDIDRAADMLRTLVSSMGKRIVI